MREIYCRVRRNWSEPVATTRTMRTGPAAFVKPFVVELDFRKVDDVRSYDELRNDAGRAALGTARELREVDG